MWRGLDSAHSLVEYAVSYTVLGAVSDLGQSQEQKQHSSHKQGDLVSDKVSGAI